jgi:hypothetical protein
MRRPTPGYSVRTPAARGSGQPKPAGVAYRGLAQSGVRRAADSEPAAAEGDDVERGMWDEPPTGGDPTASETPYADNK